MSNSSGELPAADYSRAGRALIAMKQRQWFEKFGRVGGNVADDGAGEDDDVDEVGGDNANAPASQGAGTSRKRQPAADVPERADIRRKKTLRSGTNNNRPQRQAARPLQHAGPVKRKHRFRPGTRALMDIRKLQKSTHNLIPRLPFQKLVKEVVDHFGSTSLRMQRSALFALQEAAEAIIVEMMGEANLAAIHASRVTITPKDVNLVKQIRGRRCLQPE